MKKDIVAKCYSCDIFVKNKIFYVSLQIFLIYIFIFTHNLKTVIKRVDIHFCYSAIFYKRKPSQTASLSTIFTKGTKFCDFLFASLAKEV